MAQVAHHLEEKERTRDIEIDENLTFSDLLLSEAVLSGLHAAGFRRPSPIQLAAIPLGRCGLDLVVQAKSGTGKTCVLAVIALEAVSAASPATQVLVVAPTREVAVQVAQVVSTLASAMSGLHIAAFIGGTKLAEDRIKLRQCQVVVGTPGRLAQLVSLGHLRLECVRLLVLDEADRLLEGNFHGPVMDLAKALPLNKQVLCLSATYSDAAAAQAEQLMRSPSHVRLGRESPALLGVNQLVRRLPSAATPPLRQAAKATELLKVLSSVTFNQCLVFSGSQLRAESLCHRLGAEGWPAAHLTAAQCQTERLAALKALCSHRCRVLVATDLAARGLDSPHVNLVINIDLPPDPATYLHRAGRAGRYGSRGAAVTLVCGPEEWYGARAIATLANVKLLLVGQEWAGNLATHKVKGWRRPGVEKVEKQENAEERQEEGGGGERHEQKEPEKEKDAKNSDSEKMTGVVKQEENEAEIDERDRKKDKEKPKKGKKGGGELKDENGVMRLEEVEHLPEEEARAWLKAHKPYRKEGSQEKQGQKENGVLEGEEKGKSVLRGRESLSVKGEGNYDDDVQIRAEENGDVMEKKVRKKKYLQQKTTNHRHAVNDSDNEEEKEDEEKENRKGNGKENKGPTLKNKSDAQENQAYNSRKQKQKQGQENSTDTKKNNSKEMEDKTSAMSFVNRLWQRPPPVTMSYSQLLSDCTSYYDTPVPPDTCIRVPPWPVQVEPTKKEMVALEKHLDGMKEEVKDRREALDGVRIDALTVLSAMMEGRDGGEVLGEVTQQKASVSPHTMVSLAPQKSNSDTSSSSSSSEYPTSEHSRAHKKLLSSTSDRNHTTTSSTDSKGTSPSCDQEHQELKHKTHLTECKHATVFVSNNRQRHISPSGSHVLPSQPTRDTGHPSNQAVPLRPNREHLQSATGTRPKETKGKKQWKDQESKKDEAKDHNHKNNKKSEPVTDNYPGYGEWVPVDKEDQKDHQDHSQAYAQYNQGYEQYDHAYQTYNQWYQDYYQWNQGSNQDYQDFSQGYDQQYQSYNQNYDQDYMQGYNQRFQDYNQEHKQGYYQDYNQSYDHHHHLRGTAPHMYTQGTHTHAYIESACKFASMMEYVSTMGRVSMHVAQDYYSRKKQWQKQQGRHSSPQAT